MTFSAFSAVSGSLCAEHIIGGEIYYECLGDNTYQVTMKLYRDCYSGGAAFDNPATFGVYKTSSTTNFTVQANLVSVQNIDPNFNSPCLDVPPDVCVEEGTYTFIITLSNPNTTYQIYYVRCCRNQTIQNLNNPGAQGLALVAEIPSSDVAVCNSSPTFNSFPPPVLCSFEDFEFDHSAYDPDGDSLAYSLCSPFIGGTQNDPMPVPPPLPPYNEVAWLPPFSATNPLPGDPGLSIDPVTGLLTGSPTTMGQYVVGVCVEEWRNGQLIGVNKRDFQFNVAQCEETSSANIAPIDNSELCEDLTFDFNNESDPSNDFLWDFGDPTTDDDQSTDYDASYTYPDTGTYVVTLITNPGFFCSDTTLLTVPVYYETEVVIESYSFLCIDDQPVYTFTAGGDFDPINSTITWDFGPNATPATGSGPTVDNISFSLPGTQSVEVTVENNICPANNIIDFNVAEPITVDLLPQDTFCIGMNYSFLQASENAEDFQWDFGVDNTDGDVSELPNPAFTFPTAGQYVVEVTASAPGTCPISDQETFDIQPLLDPEIAPLSTACFEGNSLSFEAAGTYTPGAVFSWSFADASPATSTAENPANVVFATPGFKPILLTVSANGCVREADAVQRIDNNPVAAFGPSSPDGCAPARIGFSNQSYTESVNVSYLWDFGDGTSSTLINAAHVYESPGTYSVSLSLENLDGCLDSDEITLTNLIEVHPTPTAGFHVDPPVVSSMDPVVNVTASGSGYSEVHYFFDGETIDQADFSRTLETVGPQTIYQTVANEFGCRDHAQFDVNIRDHLIYIPSAFSPNGDGLNDLFRPETTGTIAVDMQIFNRWGDLVYHSDQTRGWDGSSTAGDSQRYYAPPGVYNYIITIKEYSLRNYQYEGSVRLIR